MFRKGAALGTLNFYAGAVSNLTFENSRPVFTLGLVVQNTSNQSFTINSVAGDLYANNNEVGNVSGFITQHINANSETTIYLKIRMNLLSIVNNLVTAFTTGNIKQQVKLEAMANIDSLQVPINLSYTIG